MVGDGIPTLEQVKAMPYTTRVISEAMRLYPQPPVLIRRALEEDTLAGYTVAPGSDLFISVWNLHRCCPCLPCSACTCCLHHIVTQHQLRIKLADPLCVCCHTCCRPCRFGNSLPGVIVHCYLLSHVPHLHALVACLGWDAFDLVSVCGRSKNEYLSTDWT